MHSQLEHLQASIEALVNKYQAAIGEKRYLVQEVARLQQEQQQLIQQHHAAVEDLNQTYTDRLGKLEAEANQYILALQQENAGYRAMLEQSAADIRHLLSRLPVTETQEPSA